MPTHDPNEIREPVDLQVRGVMVTHEYLRRDYEEVLKLLRLHEQELALLWVLMFAIVGISIYRGHRIEQTLKEIYGSG